MKAIILGATGASGRELLNQLLADPAYSAVSVFVRKPIDLRVAGWRYGQLTNKICG